METIKDIAILILAFITLVCILIAFYNVIHGFVSKVVEDKYGRVIFSIVILILLIVFVIVGFQALLDYLFRGSRIGR